MLELSSELREIYLEPRGTAHRLRTGASIGITFWSPKLRLGALCHALLPYCPTDLTAE
jgi:hypothetical protein